MLIEQVVIDFLKTKLNMADVYAELPTARPEECIIISLQDREVRNHITAVTLEVASYALSKYEAALLDESVRTAMADLPTLSKISSCKVGGGNDSVDTALNAYRYRTYFNIVF